MKNPIREAKDREWENFRRRGNAFRVYPHRRILSSLSTLSYSLFYIITFISPAYCPRLHARNAYLMYLTIISIVNAYYCSHARLLVASVERFIGRLFNSNITGNNSVHSPRVASIGTWFWRGCTQWSCRWNTDPLSARACRRARRIGRTALGSWMHGIDKEIKRIRVYRAIKLPGRQVWVTQSTMSIAL